MLNVLCVSLIFGNVGIGVNVEISRFCPLYFLSDSLVKIFHCANKLWCICTYSLSNAPFLINFRLLIYSFFIGSLVAAILATDDDSGVNGEITYIVNEDDEDGIFFLNPVTGVFNLTRILDYESQQYYILTVRAEDGGGQFTTIRVYFNILDVNDNPPVFSLNSYSTSLMENLPPGSTVLVFNVTDADDGMYSFYNT